jgi:peptidoglycan/xylan/chitin deacetylase (PgdA/CDA1 family)
MASACPTALGYNHRAAPLCGASRTVALTFDDGPGPSTPAIIAILKRFHVRATFFNIGANMVWRPSEVATEYRDGFLIGDHTNQHPVMTGLSSGAQLNEITVAAAIQHRLTGNWPCVFRPPYGIFNSATVAAAHHEGLAMWTWNESGGDWLAHGSGSSYWVHYIENSVIHSSWVLPHAVVLMHNQRIPMPATIAALPTIIESFKHRGYRFVDLLGRGGPPGVCGNPAAPTPVAPTTTFSSGATLDSGSSITSPSGQFTLTMTTGGDLTLAVTNGPVIFRTGTAGHPGATATVSSDGQLVVSDGSTTLWTSPHQLAGAHVTLGDDGRLATVADSTTAWSTHPYSRLAAGSRLEPGWSITSNNGRCRLVEKSNGSLVLLAADGQTFWRAPYVPVAGSHAALQRDGNLIVVAPSGHVIWSSRTPRYGGAKLVVTDVGHVSLATRVGVVWSTP